MCHSFSWKSFTLWTGDNSSHINSERHGKRCWILQSLYYRPEIWSPITILRMLLTTSLFQQMLGLGPHASAFRVESFTTSNDRLTGALQNWTWKNCCVDFIRTWKGQGFVPLSRGGKKVQWCINTGDCWNVPRGIREQTPMSVEQQIIPEQGNMDFSI